MVIAYPVAIAFLTLSLLHVYWAGGGRWGSGATVPQVPVMNDETMPGEFSRDEVNRPMVRAFNPSSTMTLVVAGGLALVALLAALRTGLFGFSIAHWTLRWLLGALAVVVLSRAIGEFRLVGFFKTVTGSRNSPTWTRCTIRPCARFLVLRWDGLQYFRLSGGD